VDAVDPVDEGEATSGDEPAASPVAGSWTSSSAAPPPT
jgi:hypothetical protein